MMLALFLQQNPPDIQQIQKFILPFMAFLSFFILVGIAVVMIPCWFICKKAGQSPWLSLLCPCSIAGHPHPALHPGLLRVESGAADSGRVVAAATLSAAAALSASLLRPPVAARSLNW